MTKAIFTFGSFLIAPANERDVSVINYLSGSESLLIIDISQEVGYSLWNPRVHCRACYFPDPDESGSRSPILLH
jgi:hypothetical protein